MNPDPSILFMGSPEFAVASLDAICREGFNITGIVTSRDKPAGRGQKISTSAVKEYALSRKLPVLQPGNLKDADFLGELRSIAPDLILVVAFRMLPEEVFELPPLGTINLHASLLPQYRGAAPINWAIMNGETITGVTTFFIEKEIDTGKIILQRSTPIKQDEDAGSLHDRLMNLGANLLVDTVHLVFRGNPPLTSQSELIKTAGILKTAPKIFPEDCQVDWNRPVTRVYDHIRGLSPKPGAWTRFIIGEKSKVVKIFHTELEEAVPHGPPGSVATEDGRKLMAACQDGYLHIKSLQVEGKRRMPAEDFLRGLKDPGALRTA